MFSSRMRCIDKGSEDTDDGMLSVIKPGEGVVVVEEVTVVQHGWQATAAEIELHVRYNRKSSNTALAGELCRPAVVHLKLLVFPQRDFQDCKGQNVWYCCSVLYLCLQSRCQVREASEDKN